MTTDNRQVIRELEEESRRLEDLLNSVEADTKRLKTEVHHIHEGWLRVVDEELVNCHIGVARSTDTYEEAKDKLNKLCCWHQDIGRYTEQPTEQPKDYVDIDPYGLYPYSDESDKTAQIISTVVACLLLLVVTGSIIAAIQFFGEYL